MRLHSEAVNKIESQKESNIILLNRQTLCLRHSGSFTLINSRSRCTFYMNMHWGNEPIIYDAGRQN